ncbi:DNA-processing protein DprA [Parvularcula dongshanensis]|uniref:DNA processing protein n=1 Tax=Parvularcula dongshanensis TaxID=1173995 RepID=A0A840HZY3_9PROT|nr:DNA-processing protein DprA [Parvularcula dongshanensis]MBB4657583.1 DNA processing protein [Parvularcula dongshanensis]
MDLRELSDKQRADWLRLSRSRGVGPQTFSQLLARFGSAAAALEGTNAAARAAGHRGFVLADRQSVDAEMTRGARLGVRYVASCEPGYPAALRAIADPPPVIGMRGDPRLARGDGVALVGARNASLAGRRLAANLARDLGREGFVVVSGLARGIDGAAHEASIETGTVAVVAGGLDKVYPPEHDRLMAAIIERGCVVSEMPLGFVARARDFPKRNRIVSGLSRGVVVVEAAERSGTLITARLAAEQGREVFAVPGSPLDPRAHGTNKLIRSGATLVQSASDIIEGLQGMTSRIQEDPAAYTPPASAPADEAARRKLAARLHDLLGYTPVHRDHLIREAEAPPSHVADALLDLVLAGQASEVPGGLYVRGADDASTDVAIGSRSST